MRKIIECTCGKKILCEVQQDKWYVLVHEENTTNKKNEEEKIFHFKYGYYKEGE